MRGPSFHSSLKHPASGHFCHRPAVVCLERYVLTTCEGLCHECLDYIHFWCPTSAAFLTDLTITLYQQNQLEDFLGPSQVIAVKDQIVLLVGLKDGPVVAYRMVLFLDPLLDLVKLDPFALLCDLLKHLDVLFLDLEMDPGEVLPSGSLGNLTFVSPLEPLLGQLKDLHGVLQFDS